MSNITFAKQTLPTTTMHSLHTDLCSPLLVDKLRKADARVEGFAKVSGKEGTYHFSFNPYFLDGATKADGLELSYAELKVLHAQIIIQYLLESGEL